ncbi:WxcM-like, C-terminal [Sphingomonas gellani]|uniref:WxcM-like, C-terminal n=1 Tax=Sphingomonas gellani TaxID=1166340 RepID=A0A1H8I484_9SPHN|nr:FdtA/QdtA family cupin domain-containing protein [Sphingomonas gellani]SEN63174.1 WxcM-like, C-terminal [Sphingomonas gellani]
MHGSVDDQKLITLSLRGDDRGSLCVIEGERDTGFPIARVYYIFGTQADVARGFHAHRALRQLAVCVSGSCTMMLDDGHSRRSVVLDRPDLAVTIGPMIWREMYDFSDDAVLMVLADQHYDEADYIRDYETFLAMARAS